MWLRFVLRPLGNAPGRLSWPGGSVPCWHGRSGLSQSKREGDGATPTGTLPVRRLLYRADRGARPRAGLAATPIRTRDGWCDDLTSRAYNRPIRLPHRARHERLWRRDRLYDRIVVLGWNDAPPRPSLGSAIFLHQTRPGGATTEGCLAVDPTDLKRLLPLLRPGLVLRIRG